MSYRIPPNIRTAIMTEAQYLSAAVNTAVELSFRTADIECKSAPEEPDKVLSFFIEGLDLIEHTFNQRLNPHGVNLSISGIFTHQTPKVILTTTKYAGENCELADLCLLVTYGERLERDGLGNGLLLQAKNDIIYGADDVQCALYEEETRFRYKGPKDLRDRLPVGRRLPRKFEPALAYWELGDWRWRHFPIQHQSSLAWANLSSHRNPNKVNFGAAVVDLIRGVAGYGFKRPESTEQGWSRILFDLVEVTAGQTAKRTNLGVRNRQRGCGRLARLLLQNSHAPGCSYVVRNSLAQTLAFYSEELGELGRRIEGADQTWAEEKLSQDEEPPPSKDDQRPSGGAGEPPILGNERPEGPDDDGGAGNLIFFHFTSEPKVPRKAKS